VTAGFRNARVAERIRDELARLLREEVRDPGIGFVTLTDVLLAPDLRHARVLVTVLGDDPDESLKALNRAVPFLRRSLARSSGLRFTPQLRFDIDDAAVGAQRVGDLLERIRDDDGAASPGEDEEPR
jgi:ribosome-binding factor A